MAELGEKAQVTFVLTGPREGYSGSLCGRFWFKDGILRVNAEFKDQLKLILCNQYGCNVQGEAPIWETVETDGKKSSVKVGTVTKPEAVVSATTGDPVASVQAPTPAAKAPIAKAPEGENVKAKAD